MEGGPVMIRDWNKVITAAHSQVMGPLNILLFYSKLNGACNTISGLLIGIICNLIK